MPLNQITNLEDAADVMTDINTAIAQIDTNTTDIATLQSDVTAVEGDVTTLQGQMTTANSNISTLQGQMTTANSNISTLQSDVLSKQDKNAVSTLKDNVRAFPNDITIASTDNNMFYNGTTNAPSNLNIPLDATIPLFPVGGNFKLWNNTASSDTYTVVPAMGVTVLYSGVLTNTIAVGVYAEFTHLASDTWLRTQ